MFCSNCGNQVPDGAKFCNFCGNRIEAPAQPAQQPELNPMPRQPVQAPVQPVQPEVKAEPAAPVQPVQPEVKAEPAAPAQPVQPEIKAEPAAPAQPVQPAWQTQPAWQAQQPTQQTQPAWQAQQPAQQTQPAWQVQQPTKAAWETGTASQQDGEPKKKSGLWLIILIAAIVLAGAAAALWFFVLREDPKEKVMSATEELKTKLYNAYVLDETVNIEAIVNELLNGKVNQEVYMNADGAKVTVDIGSDMAEKKFDITVDLKDDENSDKLELYMDKENFLIDLGSLLPKPYKLNEQDVINNYLSSSLHEILSEELDTGIEIADMGKFVASLHTCADDIKNIIERNKAAVEEATTYEKDKDVNELTIDGRVFEVEAYNVVVNGEAAANANSELYNAIFDQALIKNLIELSEAESVVDAIRNGLDESKQSMAEMTNNIKTTYYLSDGKFIAYGFTLRFASIGEGIELRAMFCTPGMLGESVLDGMSVSLELALGDETMSIKGNVIDNAPDSREKDDVHLQLGVYFDDREEGMLTADFTYDKTTGRFTTDIVADMENLSSMSGMVRDIVPGQSYTVYLDRLELGDISLAIDEFIYSIKTVPEIKPTADLNGAKSLLDFSLDDLQEAIMGMISELY